LRLQELKDFNISAQLYPQHLAKSLAWNAAKNSIFKIHAAKITEEQRRLADLLPNQLTLEIDKAKARIRKGS